jgi:hypothetical protein
MDKTVKQGDTQGALRGILMAHLVLFLHIFLVAALGILVLFFRGIVNYMPWIFLMGTTLITVSAILFYRRMKKEGKTIGEMLRNPVLDGRSVEISFLGGLASMRIGQSPGVSHIDTETIPPLRQLEDPANSQIRELTDLSHLLEKDLISREEFDLAKQRLFKQ